MSPVLTILAVLMGAAGLVGLIVWLAIRKGRADRIIEEHVNEAVDAATARTIEDRNRLAGAESARDGLRAYSERLRGVPPDAAKRR